MSASKAYPGGSEEVADLAHGQLDGPRDGLAGEDLGGGPLVAQRDAEVDLNALQERPDLVVGLGLDV